MPEASADQLDEIFPGDDLDRDVWFPYYLPHWDSRERTAATYVVRDGALRLSIPVDQGLWCPDHHEEPLRVSCVQTGSFSGPVGSTIGQQPIGDHVPVAEEQPTMWGYTPRGGRIEVTMRGAVSDRSMFAFWMSGIEDRPERSGEICVAEIFGSDIDGPTVRVGMGIKAFRDPELRDEFATVPLTLDVGRDHVYGVDWDADGVDFHVDGEVVRRVEQSPRYPVQLMIGVFDFPQRTTSRVPAGHVPEMVVSAVRGHPLGVSAGPLPGA